ncbi:Signal transduction histidine kinase [Blastococcus aurantiacus]|uniref:Circadian input-output histidine kinase CikA n=1 Tax=Blastococcus aurantiacus TaxID=1550231 RepID=A0A1G7MZQ0_9ACTN|nr:response regulator [Blastococcus aurantiacus]SDF67254.1 Signal transduction histidine kinase [Blastococcus aurantiacus]
MPLSTSRGDHSDARPLRALLRRPLTVGLAALTAVALTTVGLAVVVLTVLGERVDRANDMLSALQDGHIAMLNQETALRGFLVTREARFLEPYVKGAADLAEADATLERLGGDDEELSDAFAALAAAEQRFLDEWAQPVLAAQPAVGDMIALDALLNRDKLRFDAYRRVEAEARVLVEEQRRDATALQRGVVVAGAALSLAVAGAVAVAVRRANRKLSETLIPPTQRVRETLAALAAGDVERRAPENGPEELRDIAGDVNVLGQALHDRNLLVEAREHELMAARDDAERAGQAKTAFLATMSHEIRTPLNAVLGLTDLLLTTQLTAEQRSHLETVSRSGDSLLTLINDILDFSKIEAGELDLEQAPFQLDEVVYDVAQLLAPQAAGKGLDLLVDIPGDCSWRMVGDSARLRQVVMNLIGNAVKFTAQGQVVVVLTGDGAIDDDGTLLCRVSVIDTGIGIAPEQQHRLFRSFSQGDASITRSYGGTGLGLAISQRIAEAMGGGITVYSDLGAGSTFTVSVRLTPAGVAQEHGASSDLAGRRLLVVDDNETNLRIVEHQLERLGAAAVLVGSGEEALALIGAGERFDACLLDLHMPGMDGEELAARLRAHPAAAGTPLVLLSSSTALQSTGTTLFDARLHKPVRPARLLETLRSCLQAGGRPDPAAASGPAQQPRGGRLRVLVAEDHEVNAHLIGLYLRQLGHDCERVANGQEAVAAVQRQAYDVVLMDAQMPVMGGVDATTVIRQLPIAQPRIVAVTASVLASDRTAFLGAGADEFLTKPVRLATLDATLRRFAPVDGRPAAPTPLSAPAVPVPRSGEVPDGAAVAGVLDVETVDELRDLGEDAFAHLYGTYADGLSDTLAALADAAEAGAWSEDDERSVPRLAHRLKGSSAAMGAVGMTELCQLLQTGTGASAELDRALGQLQEEGQRVQAAVTALLAAQH